MQSDHELIDDPQQDPQGLIDAMRADCRQQVRQVEETARQECAQLVQEHEEALRQSGELAEAECAQRIDAEVSRIENRAVIDHKKQDLCLEDGFVQQMTADATRRLRTDLRGRYIEWLQAAVSAVMAAAGKGPVQVQVAPDDIDMVETWLQARQGGSPATLASDASLGTGGVIAENCQTGVRHVLTIDRILYRCQGRIRRSAVEMVRAAGSPLGAESESAAQEPH